VRGGHVERTEGGWWGTINNRQAAARKTKEKGRKERGNATHKFNNLISEKNQKQGDEMKRKRSDVLWGRSSYNVMVTGGLR